MTLTTSFPIESFSPVTKADGVEFRVWAPAHQNVELIFEKDGHREIFPMTNSSHGFFTIFRKDARPGQRYWYRINGKGPFPDPASRFQPDGVHGPSQIVDPAFPLWRDKTWLNEPHTFNSIYEIHVGTFTREGTYTALQKQLPYLAELGVDAIELMPLADFAGDRNWGYDGVALFAPARCYGTPDQLRHLVDKAHALGLGVFLDVVYNHFGPDGNYWGEYSPYFPSKKHKGLWGDTVNLDGEASEHVRRFFIENAVAWLSDFHFDGLRLDATHAFVDDSKEHFLKQFSRDVRAAMKRPITLIAEDERNLNRIVKPLEEGGYGFDAVWSDDFHHSLRRFLAGDHESYYAPFSGTTAEIAKMLNEGWLYGLKRGTNPTGLKPNQFVFCVQNHDQVGNRAFGDRLHHDITDAAYRAATALLLLSPQRVLLFMGQEWAAPSPFLYFTDHTSELGSLVTESRRSEFSAFSQFCDPEKQRDIPDPQAKDTFTKSKLNQTERKDPPHVKILNFYRQLLALRKGYVSSEFQTRYSALGNDAIGFTIEGAGKSFLGVVRLRGAGDVSWSPRGAKLFFSSENEAFVESPQPITWTDSKIHFSRPGAALFSLDAPA